ncbi:hypothetical protein Pmani_035750 [Petrolisthes manimaculis]|uniref:Uncharacterized protein n=1 Tax=Petrolisthes manimaculis TaxID=1843537 RepID=A0AAE1NLL3_9EUCA|nr:hypothetical protein Pmani_035750 [Petrolisthes manimaculis]
MHGGGEGKGVVVKGSGWRTLKLPIHKGYHAKLYHYKELVFTPPRISIYCQYHSQLSTTIHNSPQPSTTLHNHSQPSTTLHNHPQLSTTIHNSPQQPTSSLLSQPFAITTFYNSSTPTTLRYPTQTTTTTKTMKPPTPPPEPQPIGIAAVSPPSPVLL